MGTRTSQVLQPICFRWFTTGALLLYSGVTIEVDAFTLLRKQGYVHSFVNWLLSATLPSRDGRMTTAASALARNLSTSIIL